MNEIREEKKLQEATKNTEKVPKEEEASKETTSTPIDHDFSDGSEPLLRDFAVKEDMNKEGMKKS